MWTIVLLALACWFFGLNREGSCKSDNILASCTFLRMGRLVVSVWSYRPGRVYYRMEAA